MKLEIGHLTDRGIRRSVNQDSLGISEGIAPPQLASKGRLLVVADGFGKEGTGSPASNAAVQSITHAYYANPETDVGTALAQAVQQANVAAYQATAGFGAPGTAGTTVTAAVIRGQELHVASVGDSRAYLLREGQLRQLTQDHSWAADQVRAGKLTPEQAAQHPKRRNLTRALGIVPEVNVDRFVETFAAGDVLLLCSDGLTDLVTNAELPSVLLGRDPQTTAQQLVVMANQRGGTDNVAVVVARAASAPALAGMWVPLAAIGGAALVTLLIVLLARQPRIPVSPPLVTPAPTTPAAAVPPGEEEATPRQPTSTLAPVAEKPAAQETPAPGAAAPVVTLVYAAPQLVAPEDEATFEGPDAEIRLEWTSVGALRADEYYMVITEYPHDGGIWHDWQWTKDTHLLVPGYLYGKYTGTRRAEWRVVAWRGTPTSPDAGVPVGQESAVRAYTWQMAPDATPTPVFEP